MNRELVTGNRVRIKYFTVDQEMSGTVGSKIKSSEMGEGQVHYKGVK